MDRMDEMDFLDASFFRDFGVQSTESIHSISSTNCLPVEIHKLCP